MFCIYCRSARVLGFRKSSSAAFTEVGFTIGKRQQKDLVVMNQVFLSERLSLNGLH